MEELPRSGRRPEFACGQKNRLRSWEITGFDAVPLPEQRTQHKMCDREVATPRVHVRTLLVGLCYWTSSGKKSTGGARGKVARDRLDCLYPVIGLPPTYENTRASILAPSSSVINSVRCFLSLWA